MILYHTPTQWSWKGGIDPIVTQIGYAWVNSIATVQDQDKSMG